MIKREKNKGPQLDPWGTSAVTRKPGSEVPTNFHLFFILVKELKPSLAHIFCLIDFIKRKKQVSPIHFCCGPPAQLPKHFCDFFVSRCIITAFGCSVWDGLSQVSGKIFWTIFDSVLERLNEGIIEWGRCVVFGGLCGWSVFYAVVCRPAYRDWWLIIGHYASPAADHIFTLNMVPGLNAQIQTITHQNCSESVEAMRRFDFDLCCMLMPVTGELQLFIQFW